MPKTIKAYGFKGMNNHLRAAASLLDDERRISPAIVLNADALDGNVLTKRQGYVKKISLTDCHSLWAGSIMLCVADGVLYRIEGEVATELCEVPGPRARMNYVEINGLVYMANPYWTQVYDIAQGTVRTWGLPAPDCPDITLVSGDMPPGKYCLCYTNSEDGRLSGNGPILEIAWEGMAQGIQLNNLPANGQCWITHPNGGDLFLAEVECGHVTAQAPLIEKLPTLGVTRPPGMVDFCYAFGRIWGANGKNLYYSDPFQPEWFRPGNFLPFLEDIVLVAPIENGLFVNSLDSTWVLSGTNPAKMSVKRIGDGAIPGTLTMAQIESGGYEISRKLAQLPSPIWLSKHGFTVGTQNGHLVLLTEARLNMPVRNQGASLYQVRSGVPRVVSSLWGLPLQPSDNALETVFTNGKIF